MRRIMWKDIVESKLEISFREILSKVMELFEKIEKKGNFW